MKRLLAWLRILSAWLTTAGIPLPLLRNPRLERADCIFTAFVAVMVLVIARLAFGGATVTLPWLSWTVERVSVADVLMVVGAAGVYLLKDVLPRRDETEAP